MELSPVAGDAVLKRVLPSEAAPDYDLLRVSQRQALRMHWVGRSCTDGAGQPPRGGVTFGIDTQGFAMNHRLPPALLASLTLLSVVSLFAQAPGVKIVRDRGEEYEALVEKAGEYRIAGQLLSTTMLTQQLRRTSCVLKLPKPAVDRLTDREIWQHSQAAHVRVGWYYLCHRCEKWHLNLAGGGYFITADGVVATCHHVIKPNPSHREAYLAAADESGQVFPVAELLAANEGADTAIIRVQVSSPAKPLALNTNVWPGDGAWCFSDPLGRASYFSKGIVNRFYWHQCHGAESARIEVSADWAPGSSGAAVLDECGNAIGHVSEISSGGASKPHGTNQPSRAASALIVFHSAVRAADVMALVRSETRE